jgi:phage tail-like protein
MTAPQGGDALATHRFGVQLGGYLVESIQEVSGLTVEQNVTEVQGNTNGGVPFVKKQPASRKPGEVTITRGLDKSTEFTQWVNMTVINGNVLGARQNLTIEVMDSQGTTVRRIQLMNAWAYKWDGPDLKAGDSGSATEKVTITFEDVTVE